MKILAFGAHPDDIEIFMYGLLSILKDRGDKIIPSIATDGSAGSREIVNSLTEIRKKESTKSLKSFGIPKYFNFKDGKLSQETKSINIIGDFITNLTPDLIITHSPNDYHPDHRCLSNIISEIASFKIPILFSENMMGVNFNPDYYVDITKYFLIKKKAVSCHKSQNPKRLIEIIETMNRFRAMQCNLKYNSFVETYSYNAFHLSIQVICYR